MKKLHVFLYTSLLFSNFVFAGPWYGEISYTGANGGMANVAGFSVDNTDDGWQLSAGYEVSQHFGLEVSYFNLGEQKLERLPQAGIFVTSSSGFFNPFSTQFFTGTVGSSDAFIANQNTRPTAVNLVSASLPGSTTSLTFDTRGLRLAGVGKLPISKMFSLNLQAGAIIPRYETTLRRKILVGITSGGSGNQFIPIYQNVKTIEKSNDPELFAGLGLTWNITKVIGLELSWEKFLDVGDENTFEQDIDTYNLAIQYHF